MDKTKQPGISFDDIILAEEEFWRDYNVPAKLEVRLDIDLNVNTANNIAEMKTVLKLIPDNKEQESLRLICKFVGFFSVIPGEENMDIEQYLMKNAPALMFPYIREHIYTITQKSGIPAIRIPPLNVMALLENKKAAIGEQRKVENS
mgnify:CR=1 FL=1